MGKKNESIGAESGAAIATGSEPERSNGDTSPRTPEGGRTSGGRTGNNTDKEQSAEVLGLPEIIINPDTVPAPESKKAPKKRKKKKIVNRIPIDAQQISALLIGVTSVFAKKPGLEMFALTAEEAGQISEPLAKILGKLDNSGKFAEYSDGIALVVACAIVFMPKFMIFFAIQKEKKKERKAILVDKRTNNEKKQDHGNDRIVSTGSTPNVQNIHKSIASAIPSII